MSEIFYTETSEYIKLEGDIAIVGISNLAQETLGDIVFVELPEISKTFNKGDFLAVIESVKSANEIFAPISGEVVEVNEELVSDPTIINKDAEGKGWICKIKVANQSELDALKISK